MKLENYPSDPSFTTRSVRYASRYGKTVLVIGGEKALAADLVSSSEKISEKTAYQTVPVHLYHADMVFGVGRSA